MIVGHPRKPQAEFLHLNVQGCIDLAAEILTGFMDDYKRELKKSLKQLHITARAKTLEEYFLSEEGQILSFDYGNSIIEKCRRDVFKGRYRISNSGRICPIF